jgi:hypothetical protein
MPELSVLIFPKSANTFTMHMPELKGLRICFTVVLDSPGKE